MKKLFMLTCLTVLTMGIASAQQQLISFTAKTPFSIGNAKLPAGTYQISATDQDLQTFECTNQSTGASMMFEADTSDMAPSTSSVTFAKYGSLLVLKSFGTAGGQGFFIPLSLPEKQAKKTGAKPAKVTQPAK
jgi:hypothetical protein